MFVFHENSSLITYKLLVFSKECFRALMHFLEKHSKEIVNPIAIGLSTLLTINENYLILN